MNPTPTYTHNLSLKWAEHGRPPLVGLLQQWRQSEASKTGHEGDGRVGTRSIFARVFVDGDGVSGDGEEVGKELPPTVLDTLLNLVSASTHYDSASKAYGIVHRSYAHIDKSPAQTLSNVPTTSALISFLSRWTYPTSSNIPPAADTDQITPHIAHQAISTAEFARDCVGILNMLSESELVEEQMISLVACFAHWLETFPEPHLLQIMPEIRKWLSIPHYAKLFADRHSLHPLTRLIDPFIRCSSSDALQIHVIEMLTDMQRCDVSAEQFAQCSIVDVLIRLWSQTPSEPVIHAIIDLMLLLSADDILTPNQSLYTLPLLSKRLLQPHLLSTSPPQQLTLLKLIGRLGSIAHTTGIPPHLKTRIGALLRGVVKMGEVGESVRGEAGRALEGWEGRGAEEKKRAGELASAVTIPVANAPLTPQPVPAPPKEDRPAPVIDFGMETEISEDAIRRLVALLNAPEFYIRAEAVGVVRRTTAQRVTKTSTGGFTTDMIRTLTRALMALLDDEDHIAAQAAGSLANLAAHHKHRATMVDCDVLPALMDALTAYNIALLEQLLRAVKPFAEEEPYATTLSTLHNLRLLRVVVHAAASYGDFARSTYGRLLQFGDTNFQIESHSLVHQDPWEAVVSQWRTSDVGGLLGYATVDPGDSGEISKRVKGRAKRPSSAAGKKEGGGGSGGKVGAKKKGVRRKVKS